MITNIITDKITSVGEKPFCYTENDHYLLHSDFNDKNITYLSIGQTVSFELFSNNGKEKGVNINIEGEYLKTGQIIYKYVDDVEDEYFLIKEKNCDKFYVIKYQDYQSLKLGQYITFKDSELVKLEDSIIIEDFDLLEELNIMDDSLEIMYLLQNPVLSFIKKNKFQPQHMNIMGTVKVWKGSYGFLNCDELKNNVYISNQNLPPNVTKLNIGQMLSFDLNSKSNKYFATNSKLVNSDKINNISKIISWDNMSNTGTININGDIINIMKQD